MNKARIRMQTEGKGLYEITGDVERELRRASVGDGLALVFVRHTSASLVIQENADPSVQRDLLDFFEELAPESRRWAHDTEGPDDMPAHVRAALTHTSEVIPIDEGRLALGTWQGLYLFEHRSRPHQRVVELRFMD